MAWWSVIFFIKVILVSFLWSTEYSACNACLTKIFLPFHFNSCTGTYKIVINLLVLISLYLNYFQCVWNHRDVWWLSCSDCYSILIFYCFFSLKERLSTTSIQVDSPVFLLCSDLPSFINYGRYYDNMRMFSFLTFWFWLHIYCFRFERIWIILTHIHAYIWYKLILN